MISRFSSSMSEIGKYREISQITSGSFINLAKTAASLVWATLKIVLFDKIKDKC